ELVITAFSAVFPPSVAEAIVSLCILSFCLSTQIGFFVYYETAIHSLFGPHAINYLKWVYFLPGVLFAGVANVDKLWVVANISVGVTALPNLVAILLLSGVFFKLMRDYLSGERAYDTALTDVTRRYLRSPRELHK
ncbi:MAG: alanine:cation symporter family protein, partial [Bacteroidetes bacterium]|nr:alanine:cation symporter family protein [Bacteroidota bacterium]